LFASFFCRIRKRFHLIERDESSFFCKQDLFQLHAVAGSVAHTLTQNVAAVVHRDAQTQQKALRFLSELSVQVGDYLFSQAVSS